MDDPGPDTAFIIYLCLLVISAVFAFLMQLGRTAISEVNEKLIRESAEDGDKKAEKLCKMLDRRSRFTDTAAVSLLLSDIVFCFAAEFTFVPLFVKVTDVYVAVIAVLGIAALFAAVFLTVLPMKLGATEAEKISASMSGLMYFFFIVLAPLRTVVSVISYPFVKIFGGDPHIEEATVTEDEILSLVDAGEETGVIEESQKEMINNIFEFDDKVASDVMTHRTDIVAVDISEDFSMVVRTAVEEGYSRIPVYDDEPDNIKGILYVKDLLKYIGTSLPKSLKIADIMREAMFIPESKKCRELFSLMTEKHLQMVVVSDEYGGVAGIVTMEDLLESIVGNMQDEFDNEDEEFEVVSENVFNIDGTSDIVEVEELLGIELPEGEYDTVAGYIISVIGKIPAPDEHPTVNAEGYSFTVTEMDDRRIVRVRVERLPETPEEN